MEDEICAECSSYTSQNSDLCIECERLDKEAEDNYRKWMRGYFD